MEKKPLDRFLNILAKLIATAVAGFFCLYADLLVFIFAMSGDLWIWLSYAVLVPSRRAFAQAYPEFAVDPAGIDDIMALLVKGEVR